MNVCKYDRFELELNGPKTGNPFVDVALKASFTNGNDTFRIDGFYDGDGCYKIRFMPTKEGRYDYITTCNVSELDRVSGSFECVPARAGRHGPVRVHKTFHFAYDDGTPFYPVGTTAYNWTNQDRGTVELTLETLSDAPFNKIRFSPFPKHYLYNTNEPSAYPYEGGKTDPDYIPAVDMKAVFAGEIPDAYQFDFTRFNPDFFRDFENRVEQLDDRGIEADIILFHPYDRWGFSRMTQTENLLYLRYIIARLASYANVWWSMANEWDILKHREAEAWEELALSVRQLDPVDHLRSIHNCARVYDQTKPWITHVSWQRTDVHSHVELTNQMRDQWQKPIVIDEIAYEGNIDQGWGNISGKELTRRFWETMVRGGYCTHGETYYNKAELIWWAKGGRLIGDSPSRIAFLREIIQEMGPITPARRPMDWDLIWGLAGEQYDVETDTAFGRIPIRYADRMICYYGFMQPSFRNFTLLQDKRYQVTLIDTWQMTKQTLNGEYSGTFRLNLPGRPYIAVLFNRI